MNITSGGSFGTNQFKPGNTKTSGNNSNERNPKTSFNTYSEKLSQNQTPSSHCIKLKKVKSSKSKPRAISSHPRTNQASTTNLGVKTDIIIRKK